MDLLDDCVTSIVSRKQQYESISNATCLIDNYNKIEAVLLSGITVKYLAEELNEKGFNTTAKSLKTELFRIRKKLGKPPTKEQSYAIDFLPNSEEKIIEIFNRDNYRAYLYDKRRYCNRK
jgi:hypothetical protein